jgi:hypothetical protein
VLELNNDQAGVLRDAQKHEEQRVDEARPPDLSDADHETVQQYYRTRVAVCAEVLAGLYPYALNNTHTFLATLGAAELVFRERYPEVLMPAAERHRRMRSGEHIVYALQYWGLMPRMGEHT